MLTVWNRCFTFCFMIVSKKPSGRIRSLNGIVINF